MKRMTSRLLIGTFILLNFSSLAFAGREGNGGDMCENRFTAIRDDIVSWIKRGGSAGLSFPNKFTLNQYNNEMLSQMTNAHVSCSDDKIFIGDEEKTCKNLITPSSGPIIICNNHRFMNTSESDQYVLAHHEYAGLAGFETDLNKNLHYVISNQISDYLESIVVKKLAIKRPEKTSISKATIGNVAREADGTMLISFQPAAVQYCKDLGSRLPTPREFAMFAISHGAKGIRETAYPEVAGSDELDVERDTNGREGYMAIYRKSKIPLKCGSNCGPSKVIDFYFNPNGYVRPIGASGDYPFWTKIEGETWEGLVFEGRYGAFEQTYSINQYAAIRCVVGK